MHRKTVILGLLLGFTVLFSFSVFAEELTITTYYPSPYGSYRDLYVSNRLGIGTTAPQTKLHLLVPDDTGIRVQAGEGGWGSARVEFYSDPIADANEWRPGYIASGDNGSFTGRLDFYTNGTGAGSKFGSVLGMSIVNSDVTISGRLTVNGDQSTATEHVYDDYDDIELLRKWRKGEPLPFETGDMLNRDRLLRDTIIQLEKRIKELEARIGK